MYCIKTITDLDFHIDSIPFCNPRFRMGARGIILNNEKKVAILFKESKNEYKLIGGGLEKDETPKDAFLREALEETGFIVKIDDFLGIIKEAKSQDNFKQTSYVFVAHVLYKNSDSNFTKNEIIDKSKILWLDMCHALELIKNCENHLLPSKTESEMSIYHTKFIVRRDYEILSYFLKKKSKDYL